MQPYDAESWNDCRQSEKTVGLQRPPNALLIQNFSFLPDCGVVLDASAGVEINRCVLANLGSRVISLDLSAIALKHLRDQVKKEGVAISVAIFDLPKHWLLSNCPDLIANIRFLNRRVFPVYR